MSETSTIQAWLAARQPVDEIPVPFVAAQTTELSNQPLDEKYKTVLRELLKRPSWERAELKPLAARVGLMPMALVAKTNEWALETYGDLLLEGDGPINVNKRLHSKLNS